jgi:hypothetical protein
MPRFARCVKAVAAVMLLVGMGASLSGCIIVTHRPSYCYYHPYHPGC